MSNSLRPHEPQHARPPCPSPTPGVHPNPCPLSQWCHPTISSSVVPFSSCLQSFPASGSFQMSQLFASGGQSIGTGSLAENNSGKTAWLAGARCHSRAVLDISLPSETFDNLSSFRKLQLHNLYCSVRFSHSVMSDSLHEFPWIAAHQASLSITNSWSSLKLRSIESVMPSSHLILCCPLFLLPPTPPSIRVFSNESTLHMRWPKYWSFSFNISPSNEYSGLISFRMNWLDLLVVQGTLKSLLQHHSSKASILWLSALFMVRLSHSYMTTGKTIALTRQTFVGKVMSLLFNILSRLGITFLSRSKPVLISWLQSPPAF